MYSDNEDLIYDESGTPVGSMSRAIKPPNFTERAPDRSSKFSDAAHWLWPLLSIILMVYFASNATAMASSLAKVARDLPRILV